MQFESVRLVHAQGVPHHFIANQLYQPTDEDHRRRGSFLILLEHAHPHGAITASLINTLIREYYRQTSTDRVSCFEHALVRINDNIKQLSKEAPPAISGTIVLLHENEIHISHIGSPNACLWRNGTLINLTDGHDSGDAHTFSVITSGEVHENDILVLTAALEHTDTLSQDIEFALQHEPLPESGRALARIFKQKLERAGEAIFARFTTEEPETYQIYVDRALETPGEKFSLFLKSAQKHAHLISSGAEFVATNTGKLGKKLPEALPKKQVHHTPHPHKTESATATVTETQKDTVVTYEQPADYMVKTYWQRQQHAKAAAKPQTAARLSAIQELERPILPTVTLPKFLTTFQPRTTYLLVGVLFLLFLGVRVANSFIGSSALPTQTSTADTRELAILQAEDALRNAGAAQVQDNIQTAIEQLLVADTAIRTISDKDDNEKSKALKLQITDELLALTKTTPLTAPTTSTTSPSPVKKLATTPSGTFAITTSNQIIKAGTETPLTASTIPAAVEWLDMVAYDKRQRVALLGKSPENKIIIASITASDSTLQLVARADKKDWPDATQIASFETNLYLVGDKMYKATPGAGGYRVAAYANNTSTKNVTAIVNNGFAFYAIENKKDMIRIAASAPRTPIKVFGVPDSFMPKTVTQIIDTTKEGSVYLFDSEKQRIMLFSTDGAYRQQYQLPADTTYTTCDANEASLICSDTAGVIKSFNLTTQTTN